MFERNATTIIIVIIRLEDLKITHATRGPRRFALYRAPDVLNPTWYHDANVPKCVQQVGPAPDRFPTFPRRRSRRSRPEETKRFATETPLPRRLCYLFLEFPRENDVAYRARISERACVFYRFRSVFGRDWKITHKPRPPRTRHAAHGTPLVRRYDIDTVLPGIVMRLKSSFFFFFYYNNRAIAIIISRESCYHVYTHTHTSILYYTDLHQCLIRSVRNVKWEN